MDGKKNNILLLFQMIFVIFVIGICIYYIFTENNMLIPFVLIFMSLINFLLGIREYKKNRNLTSFVFYLCSALFILFVAIKVL